MPRCCRSAPTRTQQIHDWERRQLLRRDWIPVGRAEEAPEPGSYFLTEIDGDQLIVIRGRDNVLRAFHNVCRHRGTAVAEEQCGKVVRLQCPYHAWIYDLDGSLIRAKHTDGLEDFSLDTFSLVGVRCEVWQGFVFLNLDPDAAPLADQLGDLVEHLSRFDFSGLRSAKRIDYDVSSNWKFIAENYSECYHCPGLHPQLNKLTPYDLGSDFMTRGGWQGGWMELAGGAETMAMEGGHRDGRPPMAGITPLDERRIYYYLVWPTMFLSLHPDYLLVHWLTPQPLRQHDGPLRMAVRAVDDHRALVRPLRGRRVLGPDEPPGLACLRAAAARDPLVDLGGRSLLDRGAVGARVRHDGRRPLRRRGLRQQPPRSPALRRPAPEAGRDQRQERLEWHERDRHEGQLGPHRGPLEGQFRLTVRRQRAARRPPAAPRPHPRFPTRSARPDRSARRARREPGG